MIGPSIRIDALTGRDRVVGIGKDISAELLALGALALVAHEGAEDSARVDQLAALAAGAAGTGLGHGCSNCSSLFSKSARTNETPATSLWFRKNNNPCRLTSSRWIGPR